MFTVYKMSNEYLQVFSMKLMDIMFLNSLISILDTIFNADIFHADIYAIWLIFTTDIFHADIYG